MRMINRVSLVLLSAATWLACGDDDGGAARSDASAIQRGDGGAAGGSGAAQDAGGIVTTAMDAGGQDAGQALPGGEGEACGSLRCAVDASCEQVDGEPVCVCSDGYEDVEGDGTVCEDIDECRKADLNDCARRARCENTPGGYTCECAGPAYEGDGKECTCADGYMPSSDDETLCLGDNGAACEGDLQCLSEECVGGTCCEQACDEPGTCETTDGATCDDGSTCAYPQAPEGYECADDDNCTVDTCDAEGQCQSRPFEEQDVIELCARNNPCVVAACEDELGCVTDPVAEGVACDDQDPCTTSSACDGEGLCVGEGLPETCDDDNECTTDACESDGEAFACTHEAIEGTCAAPDSCATGGVCDGTTCKPTGNACGGGAESCTPGEPNMCECKDDYTVQDGKCVPDTDECVTDEPCVSVAACEDLSEDEGDASCTCPDGYGGDGRVDGSGCTPCDETDLEREVDGQCVCDLGGTFGLRIRALVSWDGDNVTEGATRVETVAYSLRRHEYDDQGNLVVIEQACGGTNLDTCVQPGLGQSTGEAALGFIEDDVWDQLSPTERDPVAIPDARPGESFYTPPVASLLGLALRDPLGAWPESASDDRITWLDPDGDGPDGVTTQWRNSGTSNVCPRAADEPEDWPYRYPQSIAFRRVAEIHGGTRVISALRGTIASCDRITGTVEGRTPGSVYETEARVVGCRHDNGTRCTANTARFYDELPQSQQVDEADFVIERLPDGSDCSDVREWSY